MKGKGKGGKGKKGRVDINKFQTQSQPPSWSRTRQGRESGAQEEEREGKRRREEKSSKASEEKEKSSGRYPPGLDKNQSELEEDDVPNLAKATSKASSMRAPPLPEKRKGGSSRRLSEPSKSRIKEIGTTPNRLVLNTTAPKEPKLPFRVIRAPKTS